MTNHPILTLFQDFAETYMNVPPDDDTMEMLLRLSGAVNVDEPMLEAIEEFLRMNVETILDAGHAGATPKEAIGDGLAVAVAFGIFLAKKALL